MEKVSLGAGSLQSSRLAYGCWRIAGTWVAAEVTPDLEAKGRQAVMAAYEAGFTLFDLADIYCDGMAERIFGRALKQAPAMREKIIVATKCGIRKKGEPYSDSPYSYDFSAEHIVQSCEHSLKRIGIETIDVYILHRPDYLANPEEVASAFGQLQRSGKVREFGVSNFRPSQLALLQKFCPMKLMVNQIEISLAELGAFDDGRLDQCLAEKMTPLAWSPLDGGELATHHRTGAPIRHPVELNLLDVLDAMAEAPGKSRTILALAWLLKHPAGIVPIIGSTNPANIREATEAAEVQLTRDEWYRLLEAARGERLP